MWWKIFFSSPVIFYRPSSADVHQFFSIGLLLTSTWNFLFVSVDSWKRATLMFYFEKRTINQSCEFLYTAHELFTSISFEISIFQQFFTVMFYSQQTPSFPFPFQSKSSFLFCLQKFLFPANFLESFSPAMSLNKSKIVCMFLWRQRRFLRRKERDDEWERMFGSKKLKEDVAKMSRRWCGFQTWTILFNFCISKSLWLNEKRILGTLMEIQIKIN